MASSNSSSKYEVFLSFRGKDTRKNFTSHLFAALSKKKIETFIDKNLKRGDEISPSLLKAIEGSTISVVIFSKDYASSKWCLDKLVKILECKKINRQIVIPVFFDIHPSDVRNQTESFGAAFVEHENNFSEMPGKVQKWRDALTEASYLAGYESTKFGDEAELVGVIVKDVLKKLEDRITVSTDFGGLVRINSRIEEIKSRLRIGLSDFEVVGIWGMGGIGKTTLAEAIFKQVSGDFEGKCFKKNVRENGGALERLQKEVFSSLLGENLEKEGVNIPQHTTERLRRMKVFLVLDDVNECEQLQFLVGDGGLDRFGAGSRVIVTTRDKQVLVEYGVNSIYLVEGLNYHEAHQHFCNFAFRQNNCPEDLMELSNRVVDYAKGNPLALKVLGSFVRAKNKQDWENALHNLKRISGPRIYKVLKISYDELDWEAKNIFLDIACFFKGEDEDHVISIFDDHHLMHYELGVLVQKSLITISHKKLEMHDLLQEMGQEIVRQESQDKPGNRSRLWDPEDVCKVLTNNQGTGKIKGIYLNLFRIRKDIHLDSKVFVNMPNLRLLKFYFDDFFYHRKVHLPHGLHYLSNEVRYLHWHGYPGTTLPMNFNPDNLIELSLRDSEVQQLWEGRKEAFKLKSIDVRYSKHLARIPEPSEIPNVERIILRDCPNFSCIPLSVQNFDELGPFDLSLCRSLRCVAPYDFRSPSLPTLSGLSNLKVMKLSGCNIIEIPQDIGCLRSLNSIDLSKNSFENLPTSIKQLSQLRRLSLAQCYRLQSLSELPPHLAYLDASYCKGLESLPALPDCLEIRDASLLNVTLSQNSNIFASTWIQYNFIGCLKLEEKNILADSQLRIRYMAIATLKLSHFSGKEFSELSGIEGDESDDEPDYDDILSMEEELDGLNIGLRLSGF